MVGPFEQYQVRKGGSVSIYSYSFPKGVALEESGLTEFMQTYMNCMIIRIINVSAAEFPFNIEFETCPSVCTSAIRETSSISSDSSSCPVVPHRNDGPPVAISALNQGPNSIGS